MKVRDVMTYGVIGVPESASIVEAVETMLRSRVSAVFVFDADHALSGVLSEGDLLRRSELGSELKRPHWLELLIGSGRLAEAYAHEHAAKAGEVMTRNVETIREDAELSEAVDRMIHRRIKRLPVLRGETLVGVVSRSDLLKGLLAATPSANAQHSDAEIKAAILAELDKLEWAPRASVRVEVQNGAVTFDGAIIDQRLRRASRSLPRTRRAASPSTTTWPGSSRTRESSFRRKGMIRRRKRRERPYSATAPWLAGSFTSGGVPNPGAGVPPAARGEKESDRAGRVGADLGPQRGQILAEQRSHQHRQYDQVEEPARCLLEPVRREGGRGSDVVGPRKFLKHARHRFRLAFAPHAADARRKIGKPPRFGDRDPDEPNRFRDSEPGQNDGGKGVEPLLDRAAGAGKSIEAGVPAHEPLDDGGEQRLLVGKSGVDGRLAGGSDLGDFVDARALKPCSRNTWPAASRILSSTLPASPRGGRPQRTRRAPVRRRSASIAFPPPSRVLCQNRDR